ncbi:hypothetical protein [Polaribacter marinivivus]|jgi:hypothetical protein|uniref:hypothetical protein n=1 Tax=Polaribacter marinivivus TaxID=1524260 RepID=UPI003D32777C
MKKINNQLLYISLVILFLTSCTNHTKYVIEKGKVGDITTETTIKDLNQIFAKDSIVSTLSEGALGDDYFQDDDKYKIYEKGGKHLLTIVPKEQLDSTSTIKSVEIHDSRFHTKNNINLNSNFSDINAYSKLRVESTLQSVTLFLDDINATIAIDKEELGLRDFSTQNVSLEQIPDLARIKSFVVWFD